MVELRTAPHTTVGDATAELAERRRALGASLHEALGLCTAATGTHPLTTGVDVDVSSGSRYGEIGASMRALVHREPTMAQHVHVALPDGDTAVRVLDGMREDLPLVLALSANSPFWRAADSGFASMRTPIFSMFPRTGIPRRFGTYAEYIRAIEPMLDSGAIPDYGFLWWDARLQPHLGTIEVRIMDAQSRVSDAGALAAVVQCVARLRAEGGRRSTAGPEVLAENRFLAARDGMGARLIDGHTRRPLRDAVAELLADCAPYALALGCVDELAAATALADDPGYARQRAYADQDGITAVAARLADEFLPPNDLKETNGYHADIADLPLR